MSQTSSNGSPALWRTLGVLVFLAGAALISWFVFTREVGDSDWPVFLGSGMVGLSMWCLARADATKRGVPPSQ